jgi:hypothetical protein
LQWFEHQGAAIGQEFTINYYAKELPFFVENKIYLKVERKESQNEIVTLCILHPEDTANIIAGFRKLIAQNNGLSNHFYIWTNIVTAPSKVEADTYLELIPILLNKINFE